MAAQPQMQDRRQRSLDELGPKYKWIALSNTTLGMLIATINSSIVLIALPDIFKGININPLDSSNTSYLLWMMMSFLVVTAVLVVSFGRLGDMYGRARMYNMGFAVFTVASVFLAITWFDGTNAALWLIGWRVVQGVGGAFLMANSSAILTDVFPTNQRGLALGINGVAAIAGSFIGLVLGGVLAPIDWNLVFLVSVPFGVLGTVWAYWKLHDTGIRQKARMDWWGNITFAVGLVAILVGITYGIQPYHGHSMGWTNPSVLTELIGGVVVLIAFLIIETKVANPLFNLSLFKIRSFTFGNLANLTASLGRGGLQFILIIWLQGIWLPQHGYSFEQTPLWAGIYMLPLTVGFLLAAPAAGWLSDVMGTRWFAALGLVITAVTFVLLIIMPVNFSYGQFAGILVLNGLGMGMFAAPNRAEVMNSLPGNARGSGAGMMTTFQNAAMVLSIGIFFSLIIAGLSRNLPAAMSTGLSAHGVPADQANQLAHLPAVAVLFAAFLGYNPVKELLGNHLSSLPPDQAHFLTGRSFFPHLISGPFADGLTVAFVFAIAACVIGAIASFLCGPQRKAAEPVGAELAGVAADSAEIPAELVAPEPAPAPLNGTARHRVPDERTTELSGRILDATGRPVCDAVLTVLAAPLAGSLRTVTEPSGRQARHAKVGADGRYTFTGLPSGGDYTLIVSAPGYTPQAVTTTLDHREQRDFRLVGAGSITGTVRPAAATVVLTDARGEVVGATSTRPDGTYEFTGLPGGIMTVTAQASGYRPAAAQVEVGSGTAVDLELELPPIGGLAGVVRAPDGRPLSDVTISVIAAGGEIQGRGRTDEHGRYEIEGLAGGDYTVVASYYDAGSVPVRLNGDRESIDVVLTDPTLLSSASDAG